MGGWRDLSLGSAEASVPAQKATGQGEVPLGQAGRPTARGSPLQSFAVTVGTWAGKDLGLCP